MSRKLGQTLIDAGTITPEQLETALRNQLMLGGHLGTCLLELGFVDEMQLGATLAQALRVGYATQAMLGRADEIAVKALSKAVVEEYQAVPFRRNAKTLDVAMIDPRDLPAVDALAFASGCKIVPWVAPEVRIFEAMERLYDIPRRMRYIVISRSLQPLPGAGARATIPAANPASEPPANTGSTWTAVDHGAEFGYGRSWVEVADELAARTAPRESHDHDTGSLAWHLCRADDKDQIAHAVLAQASKSMKRVMLFSVKGDELALWDAAGFEKTLDRDALGAVGIRSLPLLDHLLGQDHYLGPLDDTPGHRELFARLGVPAPVEVLLVPVHINDRLVAVLVGDGGPEGTLDVEARDGLRLARMLGLALNLVIIKKKIRKLGALTEPSTS